MAVITHLLPELFTLLRRFRVKRILGFVGSFVHAVIVFRATGPVILLLRVGHAQKGARGAVVTSHTRGMSLIPVTSVLSSFAVARILTCDPFPVL